MAFDYYKLWKILEDKKIKREALRLEAGMSSATLAKLGKNQALAWMC